MSPIAITSFASEEMRCRGNRMRGPEIEMAATTEPLTSRIGAATQTTPGVRSSRSTA